jgi:hypothetical protein
MHLRTNDFYVSVNYRRTPVAAAYGTQKLAGDFVKKMRLLVVTIIVKLKTNQTIFISKVSKNF